MIVERTCTISRLFLIYGMMMLWLWTLIQLALVVLLLSSLVVCHELGHYWVARWQGLNASIVSIGFGRLCYEYQDARYTKWQIRLWPLGGYVDLCADNPQAIQRYLGLSLWRKSSIILAGIAVNLCLAWLILVMVFWWGNWAVKPLIGDVHIGSRADHAGLMPGDLITHVNQRTVRSWPDVMSQVLIQQSFSNHLSLAVIRDGQSYEYELSELDVDMNNSHNSLQDYGLSPQHSGVVCQTTLSKHHNPDSGPLPLGSWVLSVSNQPIESVLTCDNLSPISSPVTFWIKHQGITYPVTIQPNLHHYEFVPLVSYVHQRYWLSLGLLSSMQAAWDSCWDLLTLQAIGFIKLLTLKSDWNNMLSPVAIIDQIHAKVANLHWQGLLKWLALINCCLVFINALPIPSLDGGQFVLVLIQALFNRPIPNAFIHFIDKVLFSGLLALVLMLAIKDLAGLLWA